MGGAVFAPISGPSRGTEARTPPREKECAQKAGSKRAARAEGVGGPAGWGCHPAPSANFAAGVGPIARWGRTRRGREGAPWLGQLRGPRTATWVISAPFPTFAPRVLSESIPNLVHVPESYTLPTRTGTQLHAFPSPAGHHEGWKHKPPPSATGTVTVTVGTGTLAGADLAHLPRAHLEKKPSPRQRERTLPKGSQGDQASSDHYLPIGVDCDHCSNLSGREAEGEAGRTVPSSALATSWPRTLCGPKPGPS